MLLMAMYDVRASQIREQAPREQIIFLMTYLVGMADYFDAQLADGLFASAVAECKQRRIDAPPCVVRVQVRNVRRRHKQRQRAAVQDELRGDVRPAPSPCLSGARFRAIQQLAIACAARSAFALQLNRDACAVARARLSR